MRNLRVLWNLYSSRGCAYGPKYYWFKAADAKGQEKAQSVQTRKTTQQHQERFQEAGGLYGGI